MTYPLCCLFESAPSTLLRTHSHKEERKEIRANIENFLQNFTFGGQKFLSNFTNADSAPTLESSAGDLPNTNIEKNPSPSAVVLKSFKRKPLMQLKEFVEKKEEIEVPKEKHTKPKVNLLQKKSKKKSTSDSVIKTKPLPR